MADHILYGACAAAEAWKMLEAQFDLCDYKLELEVFLQGYRRDWEAVKRNPDSCNVCGNFFGDMFV